MASTFSTRLPPSLTNGLASARHCILTLPTAHFSRSVLCVSIVPRRDEAQRQEPSLSSSSGPV